jgi:hypothetical protein
VKLEARIRAGEEIGARRIRASRGLKNGRPKQADQPARRMPA